MDSTIEAAQPSRCSPWLDVTMHVRSQWCAHPRIKRGEILSSWLHRCAWQNGLTNHCFARRVFGHRQVWTRDIDRNADRDILVLAADSLRSRPERLREATLHAYVGAAFTSLGSNGWMPWAMPIGVYHRTRLHHGSSFCPQCLQEEPCALLAWRMAWSVHCPRHEIPLRDACQRCGAPFVFHRISLAVPGRLPCPNCGHNFASVTDAARPVTMRARDLQRSITAACSAGVRCVGGQPITAAEYLEGLRYLIRGLYPKAHWQGLADGLPGSVWRSRLLHRAPSQSPFEHWRVEDRARTLDLLSIVLADWPAQLLRAARRGRVYRVRFGSDVAPAWVEAALDKIRLRIPSAGSPPSACRPSGS